MYNYLLESFNRIPIQILLFVGMLTLCNLVPHITDSNGELGLDWWLWSRYTVGWELNTALPDFHLSIDRDQVTVSFMASYPVMGRLLPCTLGYLFSRTSPVPWERLHRRYQSAHFRQRKWSLGHRHLAIEQEVWLGHHRFQRRNQLSAFSSPCFVRTYDWKRSKREDIPQN